MDAGEDALGIKTKDSSLPDTAPPPYVPQATRCVRGADAGAPAPFALPDAGEAGTTDAGVDAEAIPVPLVLTDQGTVAKLPVFVPITFDGDDLRDPLEDFVASVGCTDYWHQVASDYGIGDAVSAAPVHVSDAAPSTISDAQIRGWLGKQLMNNPSFPAPDGNTVYAIFYPDGTGVTAQFGNGCVSFGGYHSWTTYAGKNVSYAVIPRCGQGIDGITGVTSHELIESVTDPGPGGYAAVADEFIAWALPGSASEVGDMCEHSSDANFAPAGYPFVVQRSWSNKASFLGHDPCLPADSPTWFVAAPVMNDFVNVSFFGQNVLARGVQIAPGGQKTIDVQMITDGPMGSWNVGAQDLTQWTTGVIALKMTLDKTSGQAGDVLHLAITRIGTNTTYGAEPFALHSQGASGADHVWFGVVGD